MTRLKAKEKAKREENIQLAIKHYRKTPNASIRATAERYEIPFTTLRDRIAGALSRQESHQHQQLLMINEEKSIVRWIQQMDDWGFPPKIAVVKEMAAHLAQTRASGRKLGKQWLSRFLDRHPEIASRFANRQESKRNTAAYPPVIRDYFRKLRKAIQQYGIIPDNFYNMDEKGFAIGKAAACKVICRKGRKMPRLTHSGKRTWVTVVEAVSAAGEALPPMIINKGAGHYYGWYAELDKGEEATFAYSDNGWTNSVLGIDWLKENFDKYTRDRAAGLWRLLLVDGHCSHVTWEFFDYALKNRILPVCLPPNSTHILQPLDVGLFSPLQKYYTNALDDKIKQGTTLVNKGLFIKLLFPARRLAYTKENILSAWKRAGIHPLNPKKVLDSLRPEDSRTPHIPVTPRTSRTAWSQSKQALRLVKGNTASAEKLRVLITKMDKGLQQSIADKEIAEHLHRKYRQSEAERASAVTNDRRRLTTARVITAEDVVKLREAKEAAEAEKAEKAEKAANQGRGRGRGRARGGGRGRGKAHIILAIGSPAPPSTPGFNLDESPAPKARGRGRGRPRGRAGDRGGRGGGRGAKTVRIDEEVTVYSSGYSDASSLNSGDEIE